MNTMLFIALLVGIVCKGVGQHPNEPRIITNVLFISLTVQSLVPYQSLSLLVGDSQFFRAESASGAHRFAPSSGGGQIMGAGGPRDRGPRLASLCSMRGPTEATQEALADGGPLAGVVVSTHTSERNLLFS